MVENGIRDMFIAKTLQRVVSKDVEVVDFVRRSEFLGAAEAFIVGFRYQGVVLYSETVLFRNDSFDLEDVARGVQSVIEDFALLSENNVLDVQENRFILSCLKMKEWNRRDEVSRSASVELIELRFGRFVSDFRKSCGGNHSFVDLYEHCVGGFYSWLLEESVC